MRRALLVMLLIASIALTACGNSDSQTSSGGTETIRVATFPFAASAPLFIGMKHGFFAEEGLKIEPDILISGPESVTTVVSHENQIGFSSSVPLIVARANGLPVKIIAPGELAGKTTKEAGSAVVVTADSPIHEARQLEGKTIGVVALKDIGDVTIKESLRKKGADPEKLKFVEIPFPEMNAALDSHRIDAGWVIEPFTAQAKANGARVITYNFVETEPNLTVAAYFTTEEFEEENPDAVKGFSKAMKKSLSYAGSHSAEVRRLIPTYTEIPPGIAKQMVLSTWEPRLNESSLEHLSELSQKYGLTDEEVPLNELISSR
jgi:NitT/TauT family transport system substrate-binding protein